MTFNYPKSIPTALLYAADSLGVYAPQLTRLDEKLQSLIDEGEHKFAALRVLRKGQLIFDGQYGTTGNGDEAIPLPNDAIYPLQSITKSFVATCIAILQEWGKIELWDKVETWFPEFQGEGKEQVCLWHLLCHSSGMDEEVIDTWRNAWMEKEFGAPIPEEDSARMNAYCSLRPKLNLPEVEPSWDAADEVWDALWWKAPLKCAPETEFSYCNRHYHLIKLLVERISGGSLEEFAAKYIFEPLGMNDTHWLLPREKFDRRVIKDPAHKGGQWLNSEGMALSTSASGGLKSTFADMLLFGQMFLQGGRLNGTRIISPATVRLMTKDMNEKLPDSAWFGRSLGANWGLGWDVKNGKKDDLGLLRSDRSYNHGGYGGARLLVDPDADLVAMFYLCERDEDSFYANMRNVCDALYAALD